MKEQLIEIKQEIITLIRHHIGGKYEVVEQVADRIAELVEGKWYLPGGKLPDNLTYVWVWLFDDTVVKAFCVDHISGYVKLFLENGYAITFADIQGWTPYIIPQPPTQKGGEQ
jgi:hypothetical protein